MAEVGTSMIASTPSRSNQLRAICSPVSTRFCGSATTISTRMPGLSRVKSSIARRTPVTEPGPVLPA